MPSRTSASDVRLRRPRASGRSGRRTRSRAAAETRNVTASMAMVGPGADGRRQQAGERRPHDPADVEHGLEDAVRARDLVAADEAGNGGRVGRQPQHAQDVEREGDADDDRERRPAQPDRQRHERRQDRPAERPRRASSGAGPSGPRRRPAGRPTRRSGSVDSTPTMPIANPEPVSASTRIGMAVLVIASPNELTPWPRRTPRSPGCGAARPARPGLAARARGRRARGGRASPPPRADRPRCRGGGRRARVVTAGGYAGCDRPAVRRSRPDTPRGYAASVLQLRTGQAAATGTTIPR